jgi:hypothetical protein
VVELGVRFTTFSALPHQFGNICMSGALEVANEQQRNCNCYIATHKSEDPSKIPNSILVGVLVGSLCMQWFF